MHTCEACVRSSSCACSTASPTQKIGLARGYHACTHMSCMHVCMQICMHACAHAYACMYIICMHVYHMRASCSCLLTFCNCWTFACRSCLARAAAAGRRAGCRRCLCLLEAKEPPHLELLPLDVAQCRGNDESWWWLLGGKAMV